MLYTERVAETAETEAAAWHTRLGARVVSGENVEAFFKAGAVLAWPRQTWLKRSRRRKTAFA